jgi:formylglycine-generating enzyme required for sulfatase activity
MRCMGRWGVPLLHPQQTNRAIVWTGTTHKPSAKRRGGTLPSEMQWEYAARGVESWAYPWGNDYDAERVIGEGQPDVWGYSNRAGGKSP